MRPARRTLPWKLAAYLGAVLALSSPVCQVQAAPQQILVEVVKPPVMVFDSPDQKRGVLLKPGKQTLPAGKWLKAGKSGRTFGVVRAYTLRGVKESKADGWLALTPLAASEATPYAAMLAEIMRPAGRLKGAPTPISLWYPGPFGKLWADNFRFRWAPTTARNLKFRITSGESESLVWEVPEVEAAKGALDDEKAIEALRRASASGSVTLNLLVQVDDQPFQLPVRLETAQSLPELAADLEWWAANAKGVASHLGRASAFQKRGFLSDAAQCYLAAWQAAPGSSLAEDGFRGSLARLGLDDPQIAAVMKQVNPRRKR